MNKFIKYSYIILYKKKYIVKQLKIIILNRLIWYYRILKKITSNRNKLFTSNYQKALILLLKTRLKLSIVYYSKIDKKTKRIN